ELALVDAPLGLVELGRAPLELLGTPLELLVGRAARSRRRRRERGQRERRSTLGGDLDAQDERLAARRIRQLGHRDSSHHRRDRRATHPPGWAYRTRDRS